MPGECGSHRRELVRRKRCLSLKHRWNRNTDGVNCAMLKEFHKPILEGKGATDYERYLRTDELLSLQTPTENLSHPDELTFQVIHQSSELLMKGAGWELERARVALTEGNYPNAARLMRCANAMLEHPISLLHTLETITPY